MIGPIPLSATDSYLSLITTDANLVSIWRMDEVSGTTFADSKGAHNAAINGGVTLGVSSTYLSGDASTAATFNGTSGYASIGDVSALDFTRTSPFTISAIVKPNVTRSGGATDYWIYTKQNPSAPFNGLMFGLRWDGTKTGLFGIFVADYPTQAIRLLSSYDLANGTTYLVTMTYDGSGTAAGMKLYVNGVRVSAADDTSAVAQSIAAGQTTTASGFAAELGRRGTLNKWFKGDLKDVAIFNTAKAASYLLSLAGASHAVSPAYTVNQSPRPQVLYDMDIDSDVDDVVDAVTMLALERQGELDIVGAVVSSANVKAAPTWLAIANYYGRSTIPTGVNTAAPGNNISSYDTTIASTYGVSGKTDASQFENYLTTQRRTLAAAPDNSIEYITTGDLSSVKGLLQSSADGFSSLNGVDLVAQKVRNLWVVAGNWPDGSAVSDFGSTSTNAAISNYVLANWPTSVPIIFDSISDGDTVFTGQNVMEALSSSNPARKAWELYFGNTSATNTRQGWSQIAMLPLARGLWPNSLTSVDYSAKVQVGTAAVNATTGVTSWSETPNSNHAYLGKILSDPQYAVAINMLLRDTSATALTASVNPSTYGSGITLAATVTPSSATGTVTFKDGSTTLGSATLGHASGSLVVNNLATGSHSLTAVYGGNILLLTSTSNTVAQSVSQATSSTTLASSLNPATYGSGVTLTGTVTPASATGTLTFKDGATTIGTATLGHGSGSVAVSNLTAGSHSLTVVYGGNVNYSTSTSTTLTETVSKAATATALTSSLNPSTSGSGVTLTATVIPSSASGTITFKDGLTTLGTATLGHGSGSLVTSGFVAGSHSLTAVYGGNSNYNTSTSPSLTQTVSRAATSTTLLSSLNPSTFGSGVTLTASVASSTATGSVTFKDGAATLGTATLGHGSGSCTTTGLGVGSHSLTAVYAGNSNYLTSTSAVLTQTVSKANTATALASSLNPATFGSGVTLTASLSPSSATGTLTFKDGVTTLGTVSVGHGSGSLTTTSLGVGSHSLTAVYGGNVVYNGSTSPAVTQTVSRAPSATVLVSSPNPATAGSGVVLTATVSPSSATGTLTFKDGSTTIGTAVLGHGSGSMTVSDLSAGSHSLTAVYAGNVTFSGGTSDTVTQVINAGSAGSSSSGSSSSSSPESSSSGGNSNEDETSVAGGGHTGGGHRGNGPSPVLNQPYRGATSPEESTRPSNSESALGQLLAGVRKRLAGRIERRIAEHPAAESFLRRVLQRMDERLQKLLAR